MVVGAEEEKEGTVDVRRRDGVREGKRKVEDFIGERKKELLI